MFSAKSQAWVEVTRSSKKTLKKAEIMVLVLSTEQASQRAKGHALVVGPWLCRR